MNELDLFRNFRRGVAPPSRGAKGRASARLANAVAGARTASTDRQLWDAQVTPSRAASTVTTRTAGQPVSMS